MSSILNFTKTVNKKSASLEISDSDSEECKEGPATSKKAKSSKFQDHIRNFQESWTEDFFFCCVPDGSKPQCLICKEILQQHKKSNIRRHYNTNHKTKYDKLYPLKSEARTLHIETLKSQLNKQRKILIKSLSDSECVTLASLHIAFNIARSRKPFSDGEFLKKCFIDCAEVLFDNFLNKDSILRKINDIQLSHQTIQRRIILIASDISIQSIEYLKNCNYFSLALDESNDRRDIMQLCIFYRGIDDNFNIQTNVLTVSPMKGHTRGENVLQNFMEIVNNFELNLNKCVLVATDGAANMTGKTNGFLALLKNTHQYEFLTLHCIIHMESLCAKSGLIDLNNIIKETSTIINYIKSHALIYREFQEFISQIDSEFNNIILYTAVRWLSTGKMAERFYKLIPQITTFLTNMKLIDLFPYLKEKSWILKLAFLCDITGHLNELNFHLQKRDLYLPDAVSKISAFQKKLILFREQLENSDYTQFSLLANEDFPPEFEFQFFNLVIDLLINDFSERFDSAHFAIFQLAGRFIYDIYHFSIDDLCILALNFKCNLKLLQTQLIELQSETQYDLTLSPINKWKSIRYSELRILASKILVCFASTYSCETTFSALEFIKSKYRSSLTDESLQASLICAASETKPRLLDIVRSIDCHTSN